jgi:O-antigen ligase
MNFLGLALLFLAFAACQLLIGGARLIYSLPVYGVIGLVGLFALFPRWRRVAVLPVGALVTSLVFFSYVMVRSYVSPVDYLARSDFFMVAGAFLVYLMVILFFFRTRDRMLLLFGLLVLALAHIVVGAIQFKEANQFYPWPWIQRSDYGWRASGFYICPNHLAGLLEVLALFALSVAVWSRRSAVVRIAVGYAGLCCVVGVAISGSRGGYLSLIFGVFCLAALSLWSCRAFFRRHLSLIAVAAFLALGAVGGVCALGMSQSHALQARFAAIHEPENMRFLLWESALEQFDLDPVWGTGSGTFLYYGRTFRNPKVQHDPIYVHNDYLQLLAEYGVVGSVLFAAFLLWHIYKGARSVELLACHAAEERAESGDALALHLGALSSIGAYLVHSALDFNLHIPANALLMGFVFALVAGAGTAIKGREGATQRVVAGGMRLAIFVLALVVLGLGCPKIPGEWYAEWSRQALRDYKVPEARALAAKALRYESSNPNVFYYAGEAARELSTTESSGNEALASEAVSLFEQGLKVFPKDSRTLVKLAQTFDQTQQFAKAENALDRAMKIDPNSTFVHAFYGTHYLAQGLYEEAKMEYELSLSLDGEIHHKMASKGLAEIKRVMAGSAEAPEDPLEDPPEPEVKVPAPNPKGPDKSVPVKNEPRPSRDHFEADPELDINYTVIIDRSAKD